MKRSLSVLLALLLVLAVSAPALAAIDDYAVLSEDMLGQTAVRVNTNLFDAIEGKVFYADRGDSFAVQVPAFMIDPWTMSVEDLVLLVDGPSQSMLVVMRIDEEDIPYDESGSLGAEVEAYEAFDDFAEELTDLLRAGMTDFIDEAEIEIGGALPIEAEGMAYGVEIDLTVSDGEEVMHCAILYTEAENGDSYLTMGLYLDLTDAELEQLRAVPANLVRYGV